MKFISTVFVLVNFALVSVDALLADGLKIEANHGEDVTLSFPMDKAEEAGRLRIIFTSETTNETRLIAQRCAGSERCDAVETPGVKLVERGSVSVTIQRVNSSRSGVYKVQVFNGKYVFERNVTLVVNAVQ
ncbi:hypothetical protein ABG768_016746 [Culter alburnus]|uniref:Immunoglobulin V-set domain-containing protein n=1 Tax=Culter alburnus TaxID=194366 RepID=A0AAW1Z3M9_CULAL